MVAQQESSDIPHSSQIGSPSARKNSRTSGAIGAAPEISHSAWSSPSFSRMPARASSGRADGSVTPWASSAALIFSQMRGTAPQVVGRTSGSAATTSRGSGTLVIVAPYVSAG